MGQRVILLGALTALAVGPAIAQTTSGTWQELGPRPQISTDIIRAGRINSIAIDLADDPTGNTVYVGSSYGGVWKTTNVLSSSPTYVPLMDSQPNLAINSIALDSSTHPATLYVATGTTDRNSDALLHGNGIYKSTDGGQTWTLATSADNGAHPFQQVGFSKVLVDPTNPNIIIAGVVQQILSQADTPQPFAGIYRSTDAGATWSLVFGTGFIPSCTDLVYDSVHGVYYAAISGQGIFKSTDQGATWVATASPFATASVNLNNFFTASLATRSGVVWAFIVDITGPGHPSTPTPCTPGATRCDTGMVQSDDGGATWSPLTPPPMSSLCCLIAGLRLLAAPPSSTELIFGHIELWLTPAPNGLATSWTSLPFSFTHAGDYHSIAFFDSQRWLVGSDVGFSFTANAATTSFTVVSGNLGTTLSKSASQMGNGAYLTSSQDNVLAELATGTTWKTLVGAGGVGFGDEGYSDASLTQPNQFFSDSFEARLHRSDDNGQTQVTVVDATVDSPNTPPFQQLPADPSQIILGTCRVWKGPAVPTSPGVGWATISPDLTSNGSGTGPCQSGPGYISALAGAPSSTAVIYAVTSDGHVQRTTAGTSANPTWSDVTRAPLPNSSRFPFHAVAVSPTDSNTAYVGVGGTGSGHVFVTRDGGTTWTDITGNFPDLSVRSILIDPLVPQDVYVGTAAGVFIMTDGGAGGANESWQQYGTALPNAEVFSLEFSKVGSRQLIAATYGRGVWLIAPLIVPALTLSASNVAFGSVSVGTTSPAQSVTLTNSGTASLSITSITITITVTNSSDFAQTNMCPATLGAGASCTINATFRPTTTGMRTGTLLITDNAAGSPQSVSLTGTGVAVSAPAVTLSSSNLSFGSQQVGTTSAGQMVTLTNSGTATLTISSIGASTDYAQTNTCGTLPATIQPSGTCTITASFKPTSTGAMNGNMSITDNASGSPQTIALTGTGADFAIAGPPAAVTVTAGQPASFTINLTTTGGPTVNAISFSASANPSATTVSFSPQTISAGIANGSTTLTIRTTARTLVPPARQTPPQILLFWLVVVVLALISLPLLRQDIRMRRYATLLPLAVLALAFAVVGCGGGGASSGGGPPPQQSTPSGTYTVTVTAASGGVSRTTGVTLIVN